MSNHDSTSAHLERKVNKRVEWLDLARGATIILVVFLHSSHTASVIGPINETVRWLNTNLLLDLRMPLFFFCSGVLGYWGLRKPWRTVAVSRFRVLIWIIFAWTLISFGLERLIDLYPQYDGLHHWSRLFWDPISNLWFVYAILIISLIIRLVSSFRRRHQVSIVAGINIGLMILVQFGPTVIANSFVQQLPDYALLSFFTGYLFAPNVVSSLERLRNAFVSFGIGVTCWFAVNLIDTLIATTNVNLIRFIYSIPMIFMALGLARLICEWTWGANKLSWLGKRTLEVFLFHQIFIAVGFAMLVELGITSGTLALFFISGFALCGSILAERITKYLGLSILFQPPAIQGWARKFSLQLKSHEAR
ncbi:acyltransferase family protein [Palleronia sp. LCG004]|uniref:acyltransferase family protein n=1 Tax=Palleronia sp. LCG004 TaxID=3079304 RepID=UPI0039798B57